MDESSIPAFYRLQHIKEPPLRAWLVSPKLGGAGGGGGRFQFSRFFSATDGVGETGIITNIRIPTWNPLQPNKTFSASSIISFYVSPTLTPDGSR